MDLPDKESIESLFFGRAQHPGGGTDGQLTDWAVLFAKTFWSFPREFSSLRAIAWGKILSRHRNSRG
jgi:hypothetical protein